MSEGLVQAAYTVAALLFIMSLAGLSKHETGRMLVRYCGDDHCVNCHHFPDLIHRVHYGSSLQWLLVAAIGIHRALKVEMTEMPELVAILHSFVGLATVLVGFNSFGLRYSGICDSRRRVIHH